MMNAAKIRLSAEEAELANDAEILLTKNAVMKKLQAMLAEFQEPHQEIILASPSIPPEVKKTSPKISRGENYLGLPWLVLDQPRYFELNNTFAVRTLFWWGRSFIVTLHLSGRYKKEFENRLLDNFGVLCEERIHFCIHSNEWNHHLEADNYVLLQKEMEVEIRKANATRDFLKLAKKIELGTINDTLPAVSETFRKFVKWLA